MATITSAQSGNFNDTATWVGGVVPGATDDAIAATGHVVAINVDVTVISVQQAGTGKFTLGNGRKLTGNVIANAGTFTSGGTVEVTATAGNTATIQGNVTGVSTTAANTAGVVMTGTGTLIINGNVTGSAGNASSSANGSAGVYTNVTCSITINGAITGGTGSFKRAFHTGASSNGIFTVVGNVTGGSSGGEAHGVLLDGTSASLSANGIISGNANQSHGIVHTGTSGSITATGSLITGGPVSGAIAAHGIIHTGTSGNIQATVTTIEGGLGNGSTGINATGNTSVTVTATTIQANGGAFAIQNDHAIAHTGASGTVTATAVLITGFTHGNGINHTGASGVVSVNATTVRGGTGYHGINVSGASSLVTIVGNLLGFGQSGHGVFSAATNANSGVVLTGNMTDSSLGATALYGRIFRLNATTTGITTYTNNVGYPTGGSVTRVSPDNVTGMPSASNVRSGTAYGYSNQLTGTCAIPPANAVSAGVAVDNTTGTAVLTTGDVAALIGAQIAAATTTPIVN